MGSGSFVRTNVLRIDLSGQIEAIVEKHALKTCQDIKDNSPRRAKGANRYAEGWNTSSLGESAVVHNTGKEKSLTHLLELGHLSRSGSWVPPQEHIRPAYLKNKEQFLNDMKSIKITPK